MSERVILAKVVMLSSFLTLLVVLGIFYIFRSPIIEYIAAESDSSSSLMSESEDEPIVAAVRRVNPAVVSVVATKDVPIYEQYYETLSPWGFFGGFSVPRLRESGTEEREVGGGTGFIIRDDGLIVSNHHVIADADARYSVLLSDGTSYPVDVLDSDPEIDIAVLKISEPVDVPLTVASFGSSNNLQPGQTVIAIGNALAEFQNSVSVGVISGLSRNIVATDARGATEELHQVIQTDAAINPGNSGGPLLNANGEVIGVNVATSRGADNIGFAIPAELVELVVNSVLEHGEVVKPYLGVRYITINERFARVQGLPSSYGAMIVGGESGEVAIMPESPAATAGLQTGDIIIAINGLSLEGTDLSQVLRQLPINTPLAIEVIRDETYQVYEVQLTQQ